MYRVKSFGNGFVANIVPRLSVSTYLSEKCKGNLCRVCGCENFCVNSVWKVCRNRSRKWVCIFVCNSWCRVNGWVCENCV